MMNKTQSKVNKVSLKNTSDLDLEFRACHSKDKLISCLKQQQQEERGYDRDKNSSVVVHAMSGILKVLFSVGVAQWYSG